jgi:hypothetical protein
MFGEKGSKSDREKGKGLAELSKIEWYVFSPPQYSEGFNDGIGCFWGTARTWKYGEEKK